MVQMYMEVPQKSPYVTILNKQKCNFFSFTKQEGRTGPAWGVDWCQWDGGGGGERTWEGEYKYCVHMNVNGKMIYDETMSGMGVRGNTGEW
jgi:hypothetical protein